MSACEAYSAERKVLMEQFPTVALEELKRSSDANPLLALTRLILLGVINDVSYQFNEFHKMSLQFLLNLHFTRQQIVDQSTARCT